jgi:hypothetical protein
LRYFISTYPPTFGNHIDFSPVIATIILALPDEVLLNITNRLDGLSTHPRHLALTHHRFRGVVHEALVCSGVFSVQGIPRYLDLLWPHRKWIPRIKRIHLLDTDHKFERPSPQPKKACLDFIQTMLPSTVRSCQVRRENSKDHEIWILTLLATLSAAKGPTITLPKADPDPGFEVFFKGYKPPSTEKNPMEIASAKLEVSVWLRVRRTASSSRSSFDPHIFVISKS